MRILGIDYGSKILGVAISDEDGMTAYPRGIIENTGLNNVISDILELAGREGIERIVLGLPKNMDNTLGPKAKEVLAFADQLKAATGIPVETWDERLSTRQAQGLLKETGLNREKKRLHLNAVAAQLILQNYLDAARSSGR